MGNKKGQSVLEYVIVVTAIIAVVILAARNVIGPAVQRSMAGAAGSIDNATARLP